MAANMVRTFYSCPRYAIIAMNSQIFFIFSFILWYLNFVISVDRRERYAKFVVVTTYGNEITVYRNVTPCKMGLHTVL
jgi:hypothetical protein